MAPMPLNTIAELSHPLAIKEGRKGLQFTSMTHRVAVKNLDSNCAQPQGLLGPRLSGGAAYWMIPLKCLSASGSNHERESNWASLGYVPCGKYSNWLFIKRPRKQKSNLLKEKE